MRHTAVCVCAERKIHDNKLNEVYDLSVERNGSAPVRCFANLCVGMKLIRILTTCRWMYISYTPEQYHLIVFKLRSCYSTTTTKNNGSFPFRLHEQQQHVTSQIILTHNSCVVYVIAKVFNNNNQTK